MKKLAGITWLLIASICCPVVAVAQVKKIPLRTDAITVEVTAAIGGRLLWFSLHDQPNLLSLGDAVQQVPTPTISSDADYVWYLGHEIWAGPQSQWWQHQTLNLKRAAEKAQWPPDPYTALANHKLLKQSAQEVVLQSPQSPVSGLVFTKRYALIKNKPHSLLLDVTAKNIRRESMSWDIWFNTRVSANAQVYIPVATVEDVRDQPFTNEATGLRYDLHQGILMLDVTAASTDATWRHGKLLIQPAAGWLAYFSGRQLFIIQFIRHSASAIHPEQGQVEIYGQFDVKNLTEGLLELEVHAPYKALRHNQSMKAQEVWTVLPYEGQPTAQAQVDFLRAQAHVLGLKGFK